MEITSLTWIFKSSNDLISCGIDSENIPRFKRMLNVPENPLPLIYTTKESEYNYKLSRPELGFCACFCFKEALYKAIGGDYEYDECELFLDPNRVSQKLVFKRGFLNRYGIKKARGLFYKINGNECTFVLYLLGKKMEV